MKRIFVAFGLLVAAAFALTNCAQKESYAPVQEDAENVVPFQVIAQPAEDTKTTNDGPLTRWEEGDQIKLSYTSSLTGNVKELATAFTTNGDGVFTANLDLNLLGGAISGFSATYPFVENGTVAIPSSTTQEGYDNSAHLAGANCPLYGEVKFTDLEWKNLISQKVVTLPKFEMYQMASVVKVIVKNVSKDVIVIDKVTFGVGPEVKASTVVNGGGELAVGEMAAVYVVVEPMTVLPDEGDESKIKVWVNNTSKVFPVTTETTFNAGEVKTIKFAYEGDFEELYAVADVDVEMEADRIVPSVKTLVDLQYIKQWATNLKNMEDIEGVLYDALVAIMQNDVDKAYELLGGIPGFEHQFQTLTGSARHIEKVNYEVKDYIASLVDEIKSVNDIQSLLKKLELCESYYEVSGLKDNVVEGLGSVSSFIGNVSGLVQKWIPAVSKPVEPENKWDLAAWAQYTSQLLAYEAYNSAVENLQNTITALGEISLVDLAEKALENPNGIPARLLNWIFENKRDEILDYIVDIIEKLDYDSKLEIDNLNELAKQAAIAAAKEKALILAEIAAQQDTEAKYDALNQAEVDKLNNSVWGIFKKIIDREEVLNLFVELKLENVYAALQNIAVYVENIVQYDEGAYHIVYKNCEVLQPKDLVK